MLEKDPVKRPTASEALQHPWFKSDEAILIELLNLNKLVCTLDPPPAPSVNFIASQS
jgi:serine/threonine protein kinase